MYKITGRKVEEQVPFMALEFNSAKQVWDLADNLIMLWNANSSAHYWEEVQSENPITFHLTENGEAKIILTVTKSL